MNKKKYILIIACLFRLVNKLNKFFILVDFSKNILYNKEKTEFGRKIHMPDQTYATSTSVDKIENRLNAEIFEINKHIKDNSEAIVRLETLYGTLSELPSAIASLDKSIVSLEHSLKAIDSRIEVMHDSIQAQRESIEALKEENSEQNKTIEAVDNKSKIDWSEFITKNFWSIIAKAVVVVGGVIALYEFLIKR